MRNNIENLIEAEIITHSSIIDLETPDNIAISCDNIICYDDNGKTFNPSNINDFNGDLEYIGRAFFNVGEYEEGYYKYHATITSVFHNMVEILIKSADFCGGWNLPDKIMNRINYLNSH